MSRGAAFVGVLVVGVSCATIPGVGGALAVTVILVGMAGVMLWSR